MICSRQSCERRTSPVQAMAVFSFPSSIFRACRREYPIFERFGPVAHLQERITEYGELKAAVARRYRGCLSAMSAVAARRL